MRPAARLIANRRLNPGRSAWLTTGLVTGLAASLSYVSAQSIDPAFSGYTLTQAGASAVGVPTAATSLTFKDDNTLLVGSYGAGNIYSVSVTRDANQHVNGFGSPAVFASAGGPSGGKIDGGLSYGPGGVLFYTSYSDNGLNQIKAGSTTPDKQTALGFSGSVGSLAIAPNGHLKLTSFQSGNWWDATLASDGSGTYNATLGTSVPLGGSFSPEGISYVSAGKPHFDNDSVLIVSAVGGGNGKVYAYQTDANGDPLTGTSRLFMNLDDIGGLTADPLTGDLLAIQTGTGKIYEVQGFTAVPEPGAWTALAGVACLIGAVAQRRFSKRAATAA